MDDLLEEVQDILNDDDLKIAARVRRAQELLEENNPAGEADDEDGYDDDDEDED